MNRLSGIIEAPYHPGRHGASFLGALKAGEHLSATVQQVSSGGRIVLAFGNTRVHAFANESVTAGQRLHLMVVRTGSLIHLRIVPETSSSPVYPNPSPPALSDPADRKFLFELLDRMISTRSPAQGAIPDRDMVRILIQLHRLLEPGPWGGSSREMVEWLQRALEDGGLLFEKKLADAVSDSVKAGLARKGQEESAGDGQGRAFPAAAVDSGGAGKNPISNDLKACLLMLNARLNQDRSESAIQFETDEIEPLKQAIERLLTQLDTQQDAMIRRRRPSGFFQVISHSLPLKQSRPLRLKIYYPRENAPNSPFKVAVCLDMDHLGPVRADLTLLDRHLHIFMAVTSGDARQALEAEIDFLLAPLRKLFSTIHATVQVSAASIERFDDEDTSESHAGRIDIQV